MIEEAVTKEVTSQNLLLVLIIAVTAGLGAFFGAYLKKMGEQRAQNEIFDKLLGQLVIQTRATEEIKGDIAKEVASSTELVRGGLAKDLAKFESILAEDVQFKVEILLPRIEAYKSLWAMTFVVRPTRKEPITEAEKTQLTEDMTDWYYKTGNGIFLSLEAGKLWRQARRSLSTDDNEATKKVFSTLRTQIKIDIRVYGLEEAETEIGT